MNRPFYKKKRVLGPLFVLAIFAYMELRIRLFARRLTKQMRSTGALLPILVLVLAQFGVAPSPAHASPGCPNTEEEARAYFKTEGGTWVHEGSYTMAYFGPPVTAQTPPDSILVTNHRAADKNSRTLVSWDWFTNGDFSVACVTLPPEGTYRTDAPPSFCPRTIREAQSQLGGFPGWRDDYNHPEDPRTTLFFQSSDHDIRFIVPFRGIASKTYTSDPYYTYLPGHEIVAKAGERVYFNCVRDD